MYTGIKQVREKNSQQFIDDFKRLYSFVVWTSAGYLRVGKRDVWEQAKNHKIIYVLNCDVYVSRRTSMEIR